MKLCSFAVLGRADVDKAVNTIPDQLRSSIGVPEKVEQVSGFSLDSGKKGSNFEKTNTEPEDMVEDDDEVPAKKSKVDG